VTDQPKAPANILTLTLLENSYSFLSEALHKAIEAESEPGQWKFAIFNLIQAIELSLKEKLAREHRLLVFQNVDKREQTVNLWGALLRLRDGCELSLSRVDVDTIKSAAEWRNQIVHSEFSLNTAELKPAFAKLVGFMADFHGRFLDDNLKGAIPKELWQKAVSIRDYGEELFHRANEQLAREKIHSSNVWPCLTCGWKAFVIQGSQNKCYVCGHAENIVRCDECGGLEYASQMSALPTGPDSYEPEQVCRACISSPDLWPFLH
jgi:predicted RNA-binding Zn-ribbon protein involved in translation (DUF1610 family)